MLTYFYNTGLTALTELPMSCAIMYGGLQTKLGNFLCLSKNISLRTMTNHCSEIFLVGFWVSLRVTCQRRNRQFGWVSIKKTAIRYYISKASAKLLGMDETDSLNAFHALKKNTIYFSILRLNHKIKKMIIYGQTTKLKKWLYMGK